MSLPRHCGTKVAHCEPCMTQYEVVLPLPDLLRCSDERLVACNADDVNDSADWTEGFCEIRHGGVIGCVNRVCGRPVDLGRNLFGALPLTVDDRDPGTELGERMRGMPSRSATAAEHDDTPSVESESCSDVVDLVCLGD